MAAERKPQIAPEPEPKPEEKPAVTTMRVEAGQWWADCDDDPPWMLLESITGVSGAAGPEAIAPAVGEMRRALVSVTVRWNLTARMAGSDGDMSWLKGGDLPVTDEAAKYASTKAITGLAFAYAAAFNSLPKEPASDS